MPGAYQEGTWREVMAYDRLREWIEQYVDRENDSLEQIHRPMEIFWGRIQVLSDLIDMLAGEKV